jgi:hypothetical protein
LVKALAVLGDGPRCCMSHREAFVAIREMARVHAQVSVELAERSRADCRDVARDPSQGRQ